jgi:hypothetical protein
LQSRLKIAIESLYQRKLDEQLCGRNVIMATFADCDLNQLFGRDLGFTVEPAVERFFVSGRKRR